MKKGFTGAVTVVIYTMVTAVPAFFLAAPIVNDSIARKTADELAGLPLPNHTEMIESIYKAGKLTGNGNGMQYFGALLIKSGLSFEELKTYYAGFSEDVCDCKVEWQSDEDIVIIEHMELNFKTRVYGDDYYIVYSWGDNDTIFHEFDIRGH